MTDSAKPTLRVVDGHSLAYRAFFALPVENFTTKDNQHTNAIYGFLSMLVNLIKAEQPTHMAIAFDTSRHSFRTDEYPEYKATRSETPQEFVGAHYTISPDALHLVFAHFSGEIRTEKRIRRK